MRNACDSSSTVVNQKADHAREAQEKGRWSHEKRTPVRREDLPKAHYEKEKEHAPPGAIFLLVWVSW